MIKCHICGNGAAISRCFLVTAGRAGGGISRSGPHVFWVFGPGYGDHANRRTFQPRRDGRMHSGTESGLVGGGVLGQIVTSALPSVVASAQSGNLRIGGIVSQVIAGGT